MRIFQILVFFEICTYLTCQINMWLSQKFDKKFFGCQVFIMLHNTLRFCKKSVVFKLSVCAQNSRIKRRFRFCEQLLILCYTFSFISKFLRFRCFKFRNFKFRNFINETEHMNHLRSFFRLLYRNGTWCCIMSFLH